MYTTQLQDATRTLTLRSGRELAIAEVGAKEGPVLFYFHGWPGSRANVLFLHERAQEQGIRVIGMDRPGIGCSSPQPKRVLLDWPQDVVAVADQLGVKEFSVAGVSGGGPYALACAYAIPERLISVGLIAGMAPFSFGIEEMRKPNQQLFALASKANGLLRFFFWLGITRSLNNPKKLEAIIDNMMSDLPPVDRAFLTAPGLKERFALELQESFRQGTKWVAKEGALYTKPWGFNLKDISSSVPIFLWHGALDVNVPIQMSHKLVEVLPHINARFLPDEGHISLSGNYQAELLHTISSVGT